MPVLYREIGESKGCLNKPKDEDLRTSGFPRARSTLPLGSHYIEAFTVPTGPCEFPEYLQRQVFGEDDSVPVILDGNEVGQIAVRDLLP